MVNSSRPSLRSSARINNDTFKPSATENVTGAQHSSSAISTRNKRVRESNATLPAIPEPLPNIKRLKLADNAPKSTRSSTRPAANNATTIFNDSLVGSHLKPPTKIILTQPHGRLLSATNGVSTALPLSLDDVASQVSTLRSKDPIGINNSNKDSNGSIAGPSKLDKRTLRSHDGGSRSKSELAIYFPNYEDIINDVPRPTDTIGTDTLICLVDEVVKSPKDSSPLNLKSILLSAGTFPHQGPKDGPSTAHVRFERIDLPSYHQYNHPPEFDPLSEGVFFKPHRRAERKEKQLRNIEKERAMHEKVQLERLLDGLLGHDWLRVMGVTGITDGEKKDFEWKRQYFIREVRALVDKFREWKEEEKRIRMGKGTVPSAKDEGDDEEGNEDEHTQDDMTEPPPSSDVDAWAARQLQQEASRSTSSASVPPNQSRRGQRMPAHLLPPPTPEPDTPFTSFFSKPYIRAAALGKHRYGSRTVLAFGLPVPDFEERLFQLPPDYTTPEELRASARRRRILRRERMSMTSSK